MQINRNNFEAFFLDYWDGNLGKQSKEDLTHFLDLNPDLADSFFDYKEMKDVCLSADESVVFNAKSILKKEIVTSHKNINSSNYETFAIASLEGDLTKNEGDDFREFLNNNPSVKKIVEQFRMVYLKPPKNIVFPDKDKLKQKTVFLTQRTIIQWLGAVAAILIVGVTIFYLLLSNRPIPENDMLAQKKNPVQSENSNVLSSKSNLSTSESINTHNENSTIVKQSQLTGSEIGKTNDISISKQESAIVNSGEQGSKKAGFTTIRPGQLTINPLTAIAKPTLVSMETAPNQNLENREDISMVFNDILLRDALNHPVEKNQVRKSTIQRIFANLGNKIISTDKSETNNSLVAQITNKGKETVNGISAILPVYRTAENEGKKETFLALGEKFSIYRSKTIADEQPLNKSNKP